MLDVRVDGQHEAPGRAVALADRITPGQAADIKSAPALLAGIQAKAAIADRGLRQQCVPRAACRLGMGAVIPAERNRKVPIAHDAVLCRERNRIEHCFDKLKHFRRISTRFNRRDAYFLAFLQIACSLLWLR